MTSSKFISAMNTHGNGEDRDKVDNDFWSSFVSGFFVGNGKEPECQIRREVTEKWKGRMNAMGSTLIITAGSTARTWHCTNQVLFHLT
jgi:hypothetical protein